MVPCPTHAPTRSPKFADDGSRTGSELGRLPGSQPKEATIMNFSVPTELLEATCLTKAGQLTEATAALQRMLGAGMPASSEALRAPPGPPTIDGVVHDAETT